MSAIQSGESVGDRFAKCPFHHPFCDWTFLFATNADSSPRWIAISPCNSSPLMIAHLRPRVGLVVTGDREFLIYLGIVAAATTAFVGLHRRVAFSPWVVWGLSLLGAAHIAGGLIQTPEGWPVDGRPVLYNLWLIPDRLKFDQIVHFYGAAVATWTCWQGLRSGSGRVPRRSSVEPTHPYGRNHGTPPGGGRASRADAPWGADAVCWSGRANSRTAGPRS